MEGLNAGKKEDQKRSSDALNILLTNSGKAFLYQKLAHPSEIKKALFPTCIFKYYIMVHYWVVVGVDGLITAILFVIIFKFRDAFLYFY